MLELVVSKFSFYGTIGYQFRKYQRRKKQSQKLLYEFEKFNFTIADF